MYEATFDPELGIASLEHSSTGITVRTMLPDSSRETASIQAYIGARFSRSNKSLIELAKETKVKGKAAERLENIFEGYGHRSVGDQARIMVTLENIPDLEAMYLLYLLPDYAAQQRSTRYQDFSKPQYLSPPETQSLDKEGFEKKMELQFESYKTFTDLMFEHLKTEYPDVSEKTIKARALDASRGLLPCGVLTNLVIYTSARNFSELIAELRGSFFSVRREIGKALFHLLTGTYHAKEPTSLGSKLKQFFGKQQVYIPEAKRLIRHASANAYSEKIKSNLIHKMSDVHVEMHRLKAEQNLWVETLTSLSHCGVERINALAAGLTYLQDYPETLARYVEEQLLSVDDRKTIKNLTEIGAIEFSGFADLGTLRDLNRHRSTERFFPFLESTCVHPLEYCLTYKGFSEPQHSKNQYYSRLLAALSAARQWVYDHEDNYDINQLEKDGYSKYLAPLGADTRYFISMSPKDLTYISHLRTRAGGHLSYRRLVQSWVKKLAEKDPAYYILLNNLPDIDPEEDFKER